MTTEYLIHFYRVFKICCLPLFQTKQNKNTPHSFPVPCFLYSSTNTEQNPMLGTDRQMDRATDGWREQQMDIWTDTKRHAPTHKPDIQRLLIEGTHNKTQHMAN